MTAHLLLLMRHGAAEDQAASGRDSDRLLTPAGRQGVFRVATALRAALTRPITRVIASPFLRAQETAEIVRDVLCPSVELETDDNLMPDESAYDLAVHAATVPVDTLLVGHLPNIEMVVRALATPSAGPTHPPLGLPAQFRTSTVVGLEVTSARPPYELVLVMDPSNLSTG